MSNNILALTPGGMRGAFISGVLKTFGVNPSKFFRIFGCSSSVPVGDYYRRGFDDIATEVWLDRLLSPEVYNVRRLWQLKKPADLEYLVNTCCKELGDFKRYPVPPNAPEIIVSLFRLRDGKTVFRKATPENQQLLYRATAAIPMIADFVNIEGELYADGGTSVALPVDEVCREKDDKVIFIFNRPTERWLTDRYILPKSLIAFPMHREARKALAQRPVLLEKALEKIQELSRTKRVMVIEPDDVLPAGRFCQDPQAVRETHEHGLAVGVRESEPAHDFLTS